MDEPRYTRNEDQAGRYDRHWNELLQELRIAQTGVQILFAFLLTIAFTSPFRDADDFTHDVYAVTIVLSAMSMALLIAPVSFHRIVFRQGLRDRMIPLASRMTAGGLALLMLAVCGGLLLALDVVLVRWLAITVASAALLWFIVFWYVIPARVRARSAS
ncbi:DUF6328 family protein [Jiangella sp. DSM 45060]|uniref:DUF6328 family protein n=1 Tax=Jiangella sp. DSM 45060 TaxID=1798224 RepID=UPI00087ABF76|nr:DUF6328 family protein [Jiangella sp. DSM 45060]SDT25255.1 hypothetical protein SAMN04515669_3266 [Jiangella sp. DSM 45060]